MESIKKIVGVLGKKFIFQLATMVLVPLVSIANQKYNFGLTEENINRLIEGAIAYVVAQATSDMVTKGATSSVAQAK